VEGKLKLGSWYLIFALCFVPAISNAHNPTVYVDCAGVELLMPGVDGYVWQEFDFFLRVQSSKSKKSDRVAIIEVGKNKSYVWDIKKEFYSRKKLEDLIYTDPEYYFDEMKPKTVAYAIHYNIGVEKNKQGYRGYGLFQLYDKNMKLVGKLLRAGWVFGGCLN